MEGVVGKEKKWQWPCLCEERYPGACAVGEGMAQVTSCPQQGAAGNGEGMGVTEIGLSISVDLVNR